MTDVTSKNVYGKPLYGHGTTPKTGYKRNNFCMTGPDDEGNHSVAGIVTTEFLDFSAKQGNDLRKQVGLKGGESWCLCASRWKEAFDARTGNKDPKVPLVVLPATEKSALKVVSLDDLKMFAKGDLATPPEKTVNPAKDMPNKPVRESSQIGGKNPKA